MPGRQWTEAERRQLRALVQDCLSRGVAPDWEYIGARLDRTGYACKMKCQAMGQTLSVATYAAEHACRSEGKPAVQTQCPAPALHSGLVDRFGADVVRDATRVPRGRGEFSAVSDMVATHGLTYARAWQAVHAVRAV